jgi:hypothetical protein
MINWLSAGVGWISNASSTVFEPNPNDDLKAGIGIRCMA